MQFKKGDKLSFIVVKKDIDGNPMTNQVMRSHIRDSFDRKLAEFVITETIDLGYYEFSLSKSVTSNFPVAKLYFDIEYNGGEDETSPTVELIVEEKKTYGY